MRKKLNKLLNAFGYELRRVDYFQKFMAQLLRSQSKFKFVQVGAHDGVSFDGLYKTAVSQRCAGLVIEPLRDVFERLRCNYAGRSDIVPLNVAVHRTAATQDLYRVNDSDLAALPDWAGGIASFDRQHLLRHGIPEHAIRCETVVCRPLMALVREHGFLDAHLLQIDVEGYDAEVVRMIDFQSFRPRLIKFEHKNLAGQDLRDARECLVRAGYTLYRANEDTIGWQRS